jgi:hypothetical protein
MSEAHLMNRFNLPFVYRIEESFGCFFWANMRWFEDFYKFKGNICDNCRTILKLELNINWFCDLRPRFYPPTIFFGWVTNYFLDYVQSLLKISEGWEGVKVPFFNGRFKAGHLNWGFTRDGIMSECGQENVYISVDFNYPHDSFFKIIHVVPVFKYPNGDVLMIEKTMFRKLWGEPPVLIFLHVYEPQYEVACILHDYLSDKRSLENTIFRIPRKSVTDDAGTVLKYDSLSEVFRDCQGVNASNSFECEGKFIPVGICCSRKEREERWILWKDLFNKKGSGRLEKNFFPSPFLIVREPEESSADAAT